MSMSKKNYVAVADALNGVLWQDKSDPATVVATISALCGVFRADNERFDAQRFMAACLKESNVTLPVTGYDVYTAERARLGV